MLTLYHTPGACSLAPLIAIEEAGLAAEVAVVDLRAKKLADGSDYRLVNPKGSVPALGLGSGEVLTENAAILQFLGDEAGGALLPPSGLPRYRVLEWLIFVSTEIHKGFGPLWNPAMPEEAKALARTNLGAKFDFVEQRLGEGGYLTGRDFTIADCYLFTVLRWTALHQIDLERWPGLTAYQQRVAERPSVQAALAIA